MKLFYETRSSTSNYNTYYFLCDSEEEYQILLTKARAERKVIEDKFATLPEYEMWESQEICMARYLYHNFVLYDESEIKANEYYYAHEWCGKSFTAFGFGESKRYERSTEVKYYLKPGSISGVSVSDSVGAFTGYGS